MNIDKRAKKKGNYLVLEVGDNVRVPVIKDIRTVSAWKYINQRIRKEDYIQ